MKKEYMVLVSIKLVNHCKLFIKCRFIVEEYERILNEEQMARSQIE